MKLHVCFLWGSEAMFFPSFALQRLGLAVEVLPFLRGQERWWDLHSWRVVECRLESRGADCHTCQLSQDLLAFQLWQEDWLPEGYSDGSLTAWGKGYFGKTNALSQSNLGLEDWTQVQRPGWLPFLPCGNMACPKGIHYFPSHILVCVGH